MNTALIIIDVQNIMFTYQDGVYDSKRILTNIKSILNTARQINMPVIFIQHVDENDDDFREGLESWEIHSDIKPENDENVILKRTWDSFYKTNLKDTLEGLMTTNLIIVGMQTEFCVDTSCRSAFSNGYKSILVSDGHSTFDSKILSGIEIINHHNNVLGGRFVDLKTTIEVIEYMTKMQ